MNTAYHTMAALSFCMLSRAFQGIGAERGLFKRWADITAVRSDGTARVFVNLASKGFTLPTKTGKKAKVSGQVMRDQLSLAGFVEKRLLS